MSASQMRYCMLAGRKADVEFQGQQINQQRTTLATQSSAYNTQLLDLEVPTPPSSSDFATTTYTFTSDNQTRTITGTEYDSATGTYTVSYTTSKIASQGKCSGSGLFVSETTDPNNTPNDASDDVTIYKTNSGKILTKLATKVVNRETVIADSTDASNIALINKDCGKTGIAYYKYESDGVTKYVTEAELLAKVNTINDISIYYVDTDAEVPETGQITGVQVEWSSTGRMTSITDSNDKTYNLNVSTEQDEAAYEDAMNEYEYQKSLYDQNIENINSQIDIIQSQDKKLELKLQDLDTQQEALNTEMDSVKKVIDKNIEHSFKAFG
ncbi:MAG: hypothetical protein PHC64_01925 [Candidatus Gastranaerophilales bacterium]|nr:hypothetical protein [Candidatus Gastranaerophilales bacterium]